MPTAYEIYQTYLKGPAALIRLFEQALGTAAIYGQPPPDLQQHTIDAQADMAHQSASDRLATREP
jgi:hypothetical protein